MGDQRNTVTVLMTVRNDPDGCSLTLESLAAQSRQPDEIVVVDGGSTDETVAIIRRFADHNPRIRLIEAEGANIARGRNIGAQSAQCSIIATTDSGCRADAEWLAKLIGPFDDDSSTDFVAGLYRVDPQTLLEEVVGLATMRGQLERVCPETFNPSARSLALRKSLWERAGGWPDWVYFSEDTLFDHKIRKLDVGWRFAEDAVVHWRPRGSLRAIARQFFNYGTGRGHTQIGAPDFAYNLRNLTLILLAAVTCLLSPWAMIPLAGLLLYFYVWTFHAKAVRIARRVKGAKAYPLTMCVMWVTLFANLAGYMVGSWQRWRDRERYACRTEAYLAAV